LSAIPADTVNCSPTLLKWPFHNSLPVFPEYFNKLRRPAPDRPQRWQILLVFLDGNSSATPFDALKRWTPKSEN
jgi:hypothetical protein